MTSHAMSAFVSSGGIGNLGRLPPELRLEIYTRALRRKRANDPTGHSRWCPHGAVCIILSEGLVLLAISEEVNGEGTPIFSGCHTILFI